MTTIYPGIAAGILPTATLFSYYGTDWYVIWEGVNEGMVSGLALVPNTQDRASRALPDVDVFGATWFGYCPDTVMNLRPDAALWSVSHPTIAFRIAGVDGAQFGPRFLGCNRTDVGADWSLPGAFIPSLDFSDARNSMYVGLLGGVVSGYTPSLNFSDPRNSGYVGLTP